MVVRLGRGKVAWAGGEGLAVDVVDGPGKGEEVEDGEDGHFDTEEERWDADFDVGVGEMGGGVDCTGGCQE